MSSTAQKQNLGRGLAALFGDEHPATALEEKGDGAREVPIEHLHPNPGQPRRLFDDEAAKELSESIKANGIIQPILVRKHPDHKGQFQIVAGERRWRAAQLAKLHKVPIVVRQLGDAQTLELGLVENLQRQDLGIMEEAEAFQKLITEFGNTQDSLARVLGKSRSYVANTMRLLALPDSVRTHLEAGELSAGHARALLMARDPEGLADKIVADKLNVRQTEKLVKAENKKPPQADAEDAAATRQPASAEETATAAPDKDSDTAALERDLTTQLGLKVSIDFKDPGGQVTIRYETLEQLDDLVHRLQGEAKQKSSMTSQPASQTASQPASQPTSQPASKPAPQSTSQPATQTASKPTSQPATQTASQPTTQPASKPAPQSTSQPATQTASKPASQPLHSSK